MPDEQFYQLLDVMVEIHDCLWWIMCWLFCLVWFKTMGTTVNCRKDRE